MREIVLDTETTGFKPEEGHRIVEIGCIELINHISTGSTYHIYLNPEREIPEEAVKVHGLTYEFLSDKPKFEKICDDFLKFIDDSTLIIHNAAFDMKFINAELMRVGKVPLSPDRVLDTLALAHRKFPGAPASLDALCKRFGIDNSHREKHGALLDSELLAEVYLEFCGGRQPTLTLGSSVIIENKNRKEVERKFKEPRKCIIKKEDIEKHRVFLNKNIKNNLWGL